MLLYIHNNKKLYNNTPAQVAKLVDALALGASEATHEGSSPFLGTEKNILNK